MSRRIRLKTFQSLERVRELESGDALVGSWAHVPRGWESGYCAMVNEMARRGISCDGRPPVWAWAGPVSLGDACGLLGEEDLARGFATVTFTAPRQLVLLSNYSPWCDALVGGAWPTGRDCFPSRRAKRVLQATLLGNSLPDYLTSTLKRHEFKGIFETLLGDSMSTVLCFRPFHPLGPTLGCSIDPVLLALNGSGTTTSLLVCLQGCLGRSARPWLAGRSRCRADRPFGVHASHRVHTPRGHRGRHGQPPKRT